MTEKKLDTTNVFVKFLPQNIDDLQLHVLFSPFGKIVSAKVMVDPHNWKSLGYGFVKFRTQEEAQEAMEKMTGYRIANKILMCKPSNSFVFTAPSPNLYIKPLPSSFTEDTLRDTFDKFGLIESVKIVRDQNKPDDVVGLVRYEDVGDALRAIRFTHGSIMFASWPPLIVRFAESYMQRALRKADLSPPSQRRQRMQSQSTNRVVAITGYSPNYNSEPQTTSGPVCKDCVERPVFFVPHQCYVPVLQGFMGLSLQGVEGPSGWFNSVHKGYQRSSIYTTDNERATDFFGTSSLYFMNLFIK